MNLRWMYKHQFSLVWKILYYICHSNTLVLEVRGRASSTQACYCQMVKCAHSRSESIFNIYFYISEEHKAWHTQEVMMHILQLQDQGNNVKYWSHGLFGGYLSFFLDHFLTWLKQKHVCWNTSSPHVWLMLMNKILKLETHFLRHKWTNTWWAMRTRHVCTMKVAKGCSSPISVRQVCECDSEHSQGRTHTLPPLHFKPPLVQ